MAYQFTDKWKNVDLSNAKKIPNPRNRYLADPFIVKRGSNHYCFVEDYNIKDKKGCISVYQINKNSCEEVGVALKKIFIFPIHSYLNMKMNFICVQKHMRQENKIIQV